MNLLELFLTGFLIQNIILYYFLGICSFIGVSNDHKKAINMGLSVLVVTLLSSLMGFLIYHYVLVPYNSEYLITIVFVLLIATFVQILDIILKRFFKKVHRSFGLYLPLITTNCAVLGIVFLTINNGYNLIETLVYSFSSALGFVFVIYIFSNLREKINKSPVLDIFKGYPIALITAGIMALIFSRFVIS